MAEPHPEPTTFETESVPVRRVTRDARGFSLMEAIVATVIAVIAALGMAYTFGIGRSNINRFEVARTADALAQSRMDFLGVIADENPLSDSLHLGSHPAVTNAFRYHGVVMGQEYWRVEPSPSSLPATIRNDVMRVTTVVTWTMGGFADSAAYTRIMAKP
jgi:hypothetical protein